MTMDQYKEQYNNETEQIHAPAELIARTKAAMREEEMRIRQKSAKGINVRKWAYPLTAAAALLILMSVSMMMKGLKLGDMSMSGAPANDMAMESATTDMSDGGDLDGGMAAGAAMDSEGAVEIAEEAFTDEMAEAEAAPAETPAAVAEAEDMFAPAAEVPSDKSESKEAARDESQRKLDNAEESRTAAPADNGAQSGGAAVEDITIEKVVNEPDFCRRPDTKAHTFEGEVFQVTEEGDGWAAYVETKDGNKYVIRGEAEDLETFLEMGYRKLAEQE